MEKNNEISSRWLFRGTSRESVGESGRIWRSVPPLGADRRVSGASSRFLGCALRALSARGVPGAICYASPHPRCPRLLTAPPRPTSLCFGNNRASTRACGQAGRPAELERCSVAPAESPSPSPLGPRRRATPVRGSLRFHWPRRCTWHRCLAWVGLVPTRGDGACTAGKHNRSYKRLALKSTRCLRAAVQMETGTRKAFSSVFLRNGQVARAFKRRLKWLPLLEGVDVRALCHKKQKFEQPNGGARKAVIHNTALQRKREFLDQEINFIIKKASRQATHFATT